MQNLRLNLKIYKVITLLFSKILPRESPSTTRVENIENIRVEI